MRILGGAGRGADDGPADGARSGSGGTSDSSLAACRSGSSRAEPWACGQRVRLASAARAAVRERAAYPGGRPRHARGRLHGGLLAAAGEAARARRLSQRVSMCAEAGGRARGAYRVAVMTLRRSRPLLGRLPSAMAPPPMKNVACRRLRTRGGWRQRPKQRA
jgi:hypothetical protein